MPTNRKLFGILIVAFLLLTSCGGPKTVNITLSDFAIESSQSSFNVGTTYHFVVTNNGTVNHEFMIMPMLTEDQMGMAMDMEEMDKIALAMIEEDELEPGKTMTLDFTFTEAASDGTLEFACHTPGHYELGMHLPITVK